MTCGRKARAGLLAWLLVQSCALTACTQPRPVAREAPASSTTAMPRGTLVPRQVRADRGVTVAPTLPDMALPKVQARFLAFGDTGIGNRDQLDTAAMMQRACQRLGCDFVLHLGDIIYPRGVQTPDDPVLRERFEVPYAPFGIPFYMSLGNHDYYGEPDAAVAYTQKSPSKRWILPARYHTFVVGGIRFLALDTNKPDVAQARWLREVLHQSRKQNELWVVAYGHHPRQSFGMHGHADEQLGEWLDQNLCYRVDLFVAGHEHDKQVLQPRCGVHQIISGAGAQLRAVRSGPQTVFARSSLGVAWFEAIGATLRMRFLDNRGEPEFEQVWTRALTRACTDDDLCDGTCEADPDCATATCGADKRCDPTCTDDPDCVSPGACECDRSPLACEVRQRDTVLRCGCDAACQVGRPVCVEDGACDQGCAVGQDLDCRN